MDQTTFDALRTKIEDNIAEQKKRMTPSESIMPLSQMQQDAGMSGYTVDGLAAYKTSMRSAVNNYTRGASLVLGMIAEQYKLKYELLSSD